jgi:hypothetical protein
MSLLTPRALTALRNGDRAEPLLFVAFAVGLALSAVHWSGLVAGGVLVGLLAPSIRRAILYGLYLGATVLFVFVLSLLLFGALGRWAALGQLTLLSVVLGLAFPTLGAGIRGLI